MLNDTRDVWIYTDHEMIMYTAHDTDKRYIKDRMKKDKYKHARLEIFTPCSSDAQTFDNTIRRDRSVVSDTTQLSASQDRD